MAARIVDRRFSVAVVLTDCDQSKIAATIVQSISVDVIDDFSVRCRSNYTMHPDIALHILPANFPKRINSVLVKFCGPVEPTNKRHVSRINSCGVTPCQRDISSIAFNADWPQHPRHGLWR